MSLKHIVLVLVSLWLLPAFSNVVHWNESEFASVHTDYLYSPNSCTAQTIDSLALVDIYNNTNGPFWRNRWNLNEPVCNWMGVTLDSEGYVTRLVLNNNWLNGQIPASIGQFTRITYLQLDNNALNGPIPPELGNLNLLISLFLDDNQLNGQIPEELSNLNMLQTCFLDNNQLEGTVPFSPPSFRDLRSLDIFNNNIDSLPDLTGLPLQLNRFRIHTNRLTFDDIVPNVGRALDDNYIPQDSVYITNTQTASVGTRFVIDLGIDRGLTDNVYQWYRNGVLFRAPSNSNQLVFDPVQFGDAGEYTCTITNPRAPFLTLHARTTTLNIICATSEENITQTLCIGQEIRINGVTYNETNPNGEQRITAGDQYGCDSLIRVDLTFQDAVDSLIDQTLCYDDFILANGQRYDRNRNTGTETIANGNINGCDSMITINLDFLPEVVNDINDTYCGDEEITIGSQVFDSGNPTGTVTLPNASINGCDSTINVNLTFLANVATDYRPQLCWGQSIRVGTEVFTQARTNGRVIFPGEAANGCDSIVNVAIEIVSEINNDVDLQLCQDDFRIFNGNRYDQSRPRGTEILPGLASNGCDSIINIRLSFFPEAVDTITSLVCPGNELTLHGETFDEDRPVGIITLPGESQNGCDSIINVILTYQQMIAGSFNRTLCQDDEIWVNGTTYNQSNPSGTEIIRGGSQGGCDSMVIVDLSFFNEVEFAINDDLCSNESIQVNGTTYDRLRPNGTEVLVGAAANGCDSTVFVDLNFYNPVSFDYQATLCPDEEVRINGEVFNRSRRTGTTVFENASINGCDSTVNVALDYFAANQVTYSPMLCPGTVISINGTDYDAARPSGQETFVGGSANGCDSIVAIQLQFYEPNVNQLEQMLCPGQSIQVNGITYDEARPSGTETLIGAAFNGCDSIVEIDLEFTTTIIEQLNPTLCSGDSIQVGNEVFDASRPSGSVAFIGGASSGCDSLVEVNLSFESAIIENYSPVICSSDFILVNNNRYDQDNPSGTEVLVGASASGCDSIVEVQIDFYAEVSANLEMTLCTDGELMVNNELYNFSRPSGTEILSGASQNGCDSTVFIELSFYPEIETRLEPTLCENQDIVVNNQIYNFSRPTGIEVFEDVGQFGCDSTVVVDLSFYPSINTQFETTLCENDQVTINNQVYDIDRPNGTETFVGASQNGCDSTVNIQLSFFEPIVVDFQQTLCEADQLTINNTIYDINNQSGTEVFVGAGQNGCDSTVQVTLNFSQVVMGNVSASICEGDQYQLHGEAFTTTGQYEVEMPGAAKSGCDSLVMLDLTVVQLDQLPQADAGTDQIICGDSLQLNANLPNGIIGSWTSSNPDLFFSDVNDKNAVIRDFAGGTTSLVWTLSSDECLDYSTDEIQLTIPENISATDDEFEFDTDLPNQIVLLDVLDNDVTNNQSTTLKLIDQTQFGDLDNNNSTVEYTLPHQYDGAIDFSYEICLTDCPLICDTAWTTVLLNYEIPAEPVNDEISNAITPNGDGVNDAFVVPQLVDTPELYPDAEFILFDRWGNILYQTRPYQNEWRGTNQAGKDLATGTYYYLLRLDISSGNVLKGDLTIIR